MKGRLRYRAMRGPRTPMVTAIAIPDSVAFEALEDSERRAVQEIIALVRSRIGIDFGLYRPGTVCRRVRNRMISAGIESYEHYAEYLRASDAEAQKLLERLTIKVSRFYRHVPSFDCLRESVLPSLAKLRAGKPLRIACHGCGHGEEAYTFAALMEEAGIAGHVEASDVDARALETARAALYEESALDTLPQPLRALCVEPAKAGRRSMFRVRQAVRARVRFSEYDLTSGLPPPGSAPFDIVSCQNVLIYLQRPVQERVSWMMRGCLAKGGFLCVGEAEWPPPAVAATLSVISHATRVFRAI